MISSALTYYITIANSFVVKHYELSVQYVYFWNSDVEMYDIRETVL